VQSDLVELIPAIFIVFVFWEYAMSKSIPTWWWLPLMYFGGGLDFLLLGGLVLFFIKTMKYKLKIKSTPLKEDKVKKTA
jgi:hypothetical protein